MRKKQIAALLVLCSVLAAIISSCANEETGESAETRSVTALEQVDASKAVLDKAEAHAEAAKADNALAFKVYIASPDTESEMRGAAAEMRKSIWNARDEIAAAMVAIKVLPESNAKRDYQSALDAMLDAALRLEGLSTLYDNQDGITTAILATGGEAALTNQMTELVASYENAMNKSDAIRRNVLRELGTATSTPTAPAAVITLDPNLKSSTGTPADLEMKPLIELQGKLPYPVVVPTSLPTGMKLDADLIGSGSTAADAAGYYSFRYSHPNNLSQTLTFNQKRDNRYPLSGYYLTETTINGIGYQVYWHRKKDYLPNGDPVRTTEVGDAENFIVVWKGQFRDAAGQLQVLYYSMTTDISTGWGWADIRSIIESLKPLPDVGGQAPA
ncbi:MAG: hypothetical protein WC911_05890 [Thermoleophilia bacterium]